VGFLRGLCGRRDLNGFAGGIPRPGARRPWEPGCHKPAVLPAWQGKSLLPSHYILYLLFFRLCGTLETRIQKPSTIICILGFLGGFWIRG
jgi:hypothetical protein